MRSEERWKFFYHSHVLREMVYRRHSQLLAVRGPVDDLPQWIESWEEFQSVYGYDSDGDVVM